MGLLWEILYVGPSSRMFRDTDDRVFFGAEISVSLSHGYCR